jgi:type II secretory pathway component PulF
MIAVGEESGNLHKGLHKLADYYERRAQRFIKRVTSLIEPLLILGVGLIVGFMVIAMLLPILRMNLMIQ